MKSYSVWLAWLAQHTCLKISASYVTFPLLWIRWINLGQNFHTAPLQQLFYRGSQVGKQPEKVIYHHCS